MSHAPAADTTVSQKTIRRIPQNMRGLRACLICSLVKSVDMFEEKGCDNCNQLVNIKGDIESVRRNTTVKFDGLIALTEPNGSWVAKWQRIQGCVPGMYAISVYGKMDPIIQDELKQKGIYIRQPPTKK